MELRGRSGGVRRTPEQLGHKPQYDKDKFDNTTRSVRGRLSNVVHPVQKELLSITDIKHRSGLSDDDAMKCAKIANSLYDQVSKKEPKITDDVVSAVSKADAHMYGLEYRLKQPTSIAGKIGKDSVDDGVTFQEAANKLNDTIRYTTVTSTGNFVDKYDRINSSLSDMGYRQIKCKNFFDLYSQGKVSHKAIQCVYESPNGQRFELQYQTIESQAAKNLKIPLYNEIRKAGISASRAADLQNQMIQLAERVPDPKGVKRIK